MAQEKARNVLILNLLSEIEDLATNQGVVGSNPAGRAKFRYRFNGLRARVGRPFFLRCAIGPIFRREWHTLRMKRLGSEGFAFLSVGLQSMVAIRASESNSLPALPQ